MSKPSMIIIIAVPITIPLESHARLLAMMVSRFAVVQKYRQTLTKASIKTGLASGLLTSVVQRPLPNDYALLPVTSCTQSLAKSYPM
jgi:hypothetical protein